MRIERAAFFFTAIFLSLASASLGQTSAQSSPVKAWKLPQGTAVVDNGPRTYRFTLDYDTANTKGEVVFRQQVAGEYTRGLPGGEVMWKNVTVADAAGPAGSLSTPQKRTFMEGFHYPKSADTMKPEFFKGFPDTAVVERNLVWDTHMIEMFGQNYFDQLKLNEPFSNMSSEKINMPNVGTFDLHEAVLEWIGFSQRNGQECALIQYEAFFNPLEIVNGGMTLKGRSDFWGEIWVSVATKQIEYATLREVVVGEMKLPDQDTTQVVNVFRSGTLEPVSAK